MFDYCYLFFNNTRTGFSRSDSSQNKGNYPEVLNYTSECDTQLEETSGNINSV